MRDRPSWRTVQGRTGVSARMMQNALLANGVISSLRRHGKQLAMVATDGRCLVVQLGMSGRLLLEPMAEEPKDPRPVHEHAIWSMSSARGACRLSFEDPRRFGRLTALPSTTALDALWRTLGPDALTIDPDSLRPALVTRRCPLKALLLDQRTIAGIGNIYADEILHRAALHPLTPARAAIRRTSMLASCIRSLLAEAVELGGSTIRDHRTPAGDFGSFQSRHRVYGRAGEPCRRCSRRSSARIQRIVVAGRSTFFCPECQVHETMQSKHGRLVLSTAHAQ